MKTTAQALTWADRRYRSLKTEYDTWLPKWRSIQRYIAFTRGKGLDIANDKTDANNGRRKDKDVVLPVGQQAAVICQNGMASGITPRSRPWFALEPKYKDMVETGPAKRWFYQSTLVVRDILLKSNFYQVARDSFGELPCFGTSAFSYLPDREDIITFIPYTVGEYMIAADARGRVDTFYRESWWTAAQLEKEFGRIGLPEDILKKLDEGSTEERYCVGNLVERNDYTIPFAAYLEFPFRSLYFRKAATGMSTVTPLEANGFLFIRGFKRFPIACPRWSAVGGSAYGTGPGEMALGDVMQVQAMEKKSLKAIDKQIDPPLIANSSSGIEEINSLPGGITYSTDLTGQPGLRPLYQVQTDINGIEMKIQNATARIGKAFHTDLFLALQETSDAKRMTATEAALRNDERLSQLGPVLESLDTEMLSLVIEATVEYAADRKLLPEPPQEVIDMMMERGGFEYEISYTGVLAQAQKAYGKTASIERVLGFATQLASASPDAMIKLDTDQMLDEYADATGAPPTVTRSDAEVSAIRQAQAEAAQQQQMQEQQMASAQQAQQYSGAAVNLAKAAQMGVQ
jgi:hypothetical protein